MSIKKLSQEEKDVLFSDFPESQVEFDKETMLKYSRNVRGSVRLATGRFYTPKQMKERAKKAFSVKLF